MSAHPLLWAKVCSATTKLHASFHDFLATLIAYLASAGTPYPRASLSWYGRRRLKERVSYSHSWHLLRTGSSRRKDIYGASLKIINFLIELTTHIWRYEAEIGNAADF